MWGCNFAAWLVDIFDTVLGGEGGAGDGRGLAPEFNFSKRKH